MSQFYTNIFSMQDNIQVHVCVLKAEIKVARNKNKNNTFYTSCFSVSNSWFYYLVIEKNLIN